MKTMRPNYSMQLTALRAAADAAVMPTKPKPSSDNREGANPVGSRRTHLRRWPVAIIGCSIPAILAVACDRRPPMTFGSWIGDARRSDAMDQISVTVDSGGTTGRITLVAWQVDSAIAARTHAAGDSVVFEAVVHKDTLRLTGALADNRWLGAVTMGKRQADVEMARVIPMEPRARRGVVGTYRTENGRILGIAPFLEFGERLMLTDYQTGRIGPLLTLTPDRSLVGHAIIFPIFPGDSLRMRWSGDRVEEIRFAERGRSLAVATRIATRDEDVQFTSDTVRLAGTLVLPPGPPPYPAVVLVHGSQAQTRDALGPWARFFVSAGFAVLSYDKRGTGSSSGDWKEADFAALADDVLAGLRFLTARPDIDRTRVGLWGISQGGWILPIVAAKASSEVTFLIVHAGSGATVREEGLHYLEAELRAAGLPPASVAVGIRYQQLDDAVTATGRGWNALQRYYEEQRAAEPWLWPPRAPDDWFRRYFRMLMDFDPTPFWRQVQCPVLLFYGEVDANVPPSVSWPPIERALREGGNSRVTMFVLPKANHVFLQARTGGRDEYPGLSRFAPDYFSRMAGWLEATVR